MDLVHLLQENMLLSDIFKAKALYLSTGFENLCC